MNRDKSYKEQRHDYDFIEGPIANDKIQHRLRQFLRGRMGRYLIDNNAISNYFALLLGVYCCFTVIFF